MKAREEEVGHDFAKACVPSRYSNAEMSFQSQSLNSEARINQGLEANKKLAIELGINISRKAYQRLAKNNVPGAPYS